MAALRRNLNASWWFGSAVIITSGPGRVAAHEVLALDRRAGGAAADDAAALEDLVELAVGQRVRVGIDDVPLASAVEPDGVGVAQDFGELLGVGHLRIVRVQHPHVLQAQPASTAR